MAGGGSLAELQLRIYWHGVGNEMQNKAEAQPAEDGAWAYLSLAIILMLFYVLC